MSDFVIGLEKWSENPELSKDWGRCAFLCNQASVDRNLKPAWAIAHEILADRLVAFLGPQHGFVSTVQDNMIETDHLRHGPTGLPIHSLYSESREPTEDMLDGVDTIICDLQIVGCRIYTWKSTFAGCLRSAKKYGKKVVMLDRPNPLGGCQVEGRVLSEDASSFVGQFPIPMRHGLSSAEAALLFNVDIGADLEVVALEGWNPQKHWNDLGRRWVLTSPNLPTVDPVYVFPGMVLFEGTEVSEGRGTGLPFQLIGHPQLKDTVSFVRRIQELAGQTGVHLRETAFEPTSQKWTAQTCLGVQLHIEDYENLKSYRLGLAMVRTFIEQLGDDFAWKAPPYEYDYETLPMKLIVGDLATEDHFRSDQFSVDDQFWKAGIDDYLERIKPHLLYPRTMVDWT